MISKWLCEYQPVVDYLQQVRGIRLDTAHMFGMGYVPPNEQTFEPMLRGKIVVPIYDIQCRTIAYAARALVKGAVPKWWNTPYPKGENLYGLSLTRPFIHNKGVGIVVEGYFDVMAAWQVGLPNVVAMCGSTLTESQQALLDRFCDRIIVVVDGDIEKKEPYISPLPGLTIELCYMPVGYDPDDFLLKEGPDAFWKYITTRCQGVSHKITV